jgi:beta-lactam-binding protein with PASTA domain
MEGKIRTSLIYLVTAVVSFFFGLFVLDQVILPQITVGGRLVDVPHLEGVPLGQARAMCDKEGLYLTVRGETYNSEYAANHILKQDPESGVVVKQGRQVYVILSLGPEIVSVPHVIGLTQRQATLLIERSRLEVDTVLLISDSDVANGRVIELRPEAGSALPRGGKVVLSVSKGVKKVKVPSVIDRSLEEASALLAEAGLELGEISYRISRYLPPDRVIDQQPLERTSVERGTPVNLVISTSAP